jgi:hypothetical protein
VIDSILKYLSRITVAGAAISFVVGLIKYLDQRAREERTKRFELYHNLMRTISAFGTGTDPCALTQQVAAIYELQHFRDYAYASTPILKHLRETFEKRDAPMVLLEATENTLTVLENRGKLEVASKVE